MTAALRCSGISKSFGGVEALANLSIEFPDQGVTAIIGPNGAGKTTLFDVISGFTRPDAGACFIGDIETTGWSADRIARQGLVRTFQDVRLVRAVSVMENVLLAMARPTEEKMFFGRYINRTLAARYDDKATGWLKFAGLDAVKEKKAGELSYGQQKMLTLVCCLCADRDILMLDEPVAGIHPDLADEVVALLRSVSSEGRRLVIIEHDLEAVKKVADHVIVLDAGKLVREGPTAAVLQDPAVMDAYLD